MLLKRIASQSEAIGAIVSGYSNLGAMLWGPAPSEGGPCESLP